MRKLFICLSVLLLPHLGQCGILFSENFSSGTLPSGWTNDSLGYQAIHLWYFNNPYARSITGANFDTNFAIFDSDQGSVDDGIPEIASLTTPQINIAGNTDQLFLVFDQQFQSVTNSSTLIEYSLDGNNTWYTLQYSINDIGYPDAIHSNILVNVGTNASTIQFKFTFTGDFGWWWAIDNVMLKHFDVPINSSIEWGKAFGGSSTDIPYAIQSTLDGGSIVAGYSKSSNGDVSGSHGAEDYWVIKLDSLGTMQWQKTYGGSGIDKAYDIKQTIDSGFVIAGSSSSSNGDVVGSHGSIESWIVRIDKFGSIIWKKCYGGTGSESANSIQITPDGGYIFAGNSSSINGDVTINHGGSDYWVVKIDSVGVIQWQKSLGGSAGEIAKSIQVTSNGDYIIGGFSSSNNNDVSGNHGGNDYWIVKLDNSGTILWQKSYGGSGGDQANSIIVTNDGGYIVAGYSNSLDNDVTGNQGGNDYWVVKIDSMGTLLWQKSLGGTGYDIAYNIKQSQDSGFVIVGSTTSLDGDILGNHGVGEYWIVKLDSVGTLEWQRPLGGSSYEYAYAFDTTNNGGYILAGESSSSDGDVNYNHGLSDYWIVKLSKCINEMPLITTSGPLVFCDGDSVQLTSNLTDGITWSSGDTIPSITISSTEYVYLTRTEGQCSISLDFQTTNNPRPAKPSISVTGSLRLCYGNSVTLTSSSASLNSWSNGYSSPSINVTTAGAYTVTVRNSFYCTSTSDTVNVIGPPIYYNICLVAVDTVSNYNVIMWDKPTVQVIDSFYVYKEGTVSGSYFKIGALDPNDMSIFTDSSSNPQQKADRYKICSLDSCGNQTTLSSAHKTIHLSINQGIGNTYNLIWDAYEGFTYGTYYIMRGTSPGNLVTIDSVQSSLTSYTDLTPPVGPVYYAIEIRKAIACNPTAKLSTTGYISSRSNLKNNNTAGLIDSDLLRNVILYPNPASNQVTLNLGYSVSSKQNLKLKIENAIGQTVYEKQISDQYTNIELTSLSGKGIYQFLITDINGNIAKALRLVVN